MFQNSLCLFAIIVGGLLIVIGGLAGAGLMILGGAGLAVIGLLYFLNVPDRLTQHGH